MQAVQPSTKQRHQSSIEKHLITEKTNKSQIKDTIRQWRKIDIIKVKSSILRRYNWSNPYLKICKISALGRYSWRYLHHHRFQRRWSAFFRINKKGTHKYESLDIDCNVDRAYPRLKLWWSHFKRGICVLDIARVEEAEGV